MSPRSACLLLPGLLAACAPTVDGIDPNDLPYSDPYAGAQDVDFAAREIEAESLAAGATAEVPVQILNVGGATLELLDVGLAPWSDPAWSLREDSVPAEIEADSSATVILDVTGPYGRDAWASLELRTNDPDEEESAIALVARTGDAAPSVRLEPLTLDFGFGFTSVEARATITVQNIGEAPLSVTAVELEQGSAQAAFGLSCPGQPTAPGAQGEPACADWQDDVLAALLATPIPGGGSVDIEIAWLPANLATNSATLRVHTTDPERPVLSAQVRGNGDGAVGCTPPTIALVSPTAPVEYVPGNDAHMLVTVSVTDADQPAASTFVELYIEGVLIEDEFVSTAGEAEFDLRIDTHEPSIPDGVHTVTLRAVDSCNLTSEVSFVAAVNTIFTGADADADGWVAADDCDDSDADVWPGAIELADGVDQDCDGDIDEGTVAFDDDCDGYCEDDALCSGQPAGCSGLAAAPFGDCDDSAADEDADGEPDGATRYPGAAEVANHRDDDCDGVRDEGTGLADDDGDGFNNASGDCDDEDASVFPGATEFCDELDNDCEGGADEDCVEQTIGPQVIGPLRTSRFRVGLGVQTEVTAQVIGGSGTRTFQWESSVGSFVGGTDGSTATWQAPDADADGQALQGSFPSIVVTVTDGEGRSDTGFGIVELGGSSISQAGGCAVGGAGSGLLALLLLGVRRRRA